MIETGDGGSVSIRNKRRGHPGTEKLSEGSQVKERGRKGGEMLNLG